MRPRSEQSPEELLATVEHLESVVEASLPPKQETVINTHSLKIPPRLESKKSQDVRTDGEDVSTELEHIAQVHTVRGDLQESSKEERPATVPDIPLPNDMMYPIDQELLDRGGIGDDPWSLPLEEMSQEEIDLGMPCDFPTALHFMEMSYNEAMEEYFRNYINPKQTNMEGIGKLASFHDLMKTIGLDVFVPSNWDGVNGVKPLMLNIDWANLPAHHRVKAHPINPKLVENAYKELVRL
jgi:hypothetical protein